MSRAALPFAVEAGARAIVIVVVSRAASIARLVP
jgi:hypothetical protein